MMLTKTKPDGSWSVIGSNGKEILWKDIPNALYGALCKLHAYEKTGFSPELVAFIREDNTRLGEENKRLKSLVDTIEDVPNALNGALCKLHAYEQTKLSPRAIELLCEKQVTLICEKSRLLAENNRLKSLVDTLEKTLKGSGNNG